MSSLTGLERTVSAPRKVEAKIFTCGYNEEKVISNSNRLADEILAEEFTPIEVAFLLSRLCKMFGGGLYGEEYPLTKTDDDIYIEFPVQPSLDKAMILAGCFIEKTQFALEETIKTGKWPGTEFFIPSKAFEEIKKLTREVENGR